MGYSGCDDFDIIPCFMQTRPGKGLTWIEHGWQEIQKITQIPANKTPSVRIHLLQLFNQEESLVTIIRGNTNTILGIGYMSIAVQYNWMDVFQTWLDSHFNAISVRKLVLVLLLNSREMHRDCISVLTAVDCSTQTKAQTENLHYILSCSYVSLDEHDKAIIYLAKLLDSNQFMQGISLKGYAYYGLARINNRKGLFNNAAIYLQEAFNIFHENPNKQQLSDLFHEQGMLFIEMGEYEKGIHSLEFSIEICIEQGDLNGTAIGYNEMTRAYTRLDQLDEAEATILKAIEICHFGLNLDIAGIVHHSYGMVKYQRQDFMAAIKEFETAVAFETQACDNYNLAHSYHGLGDTYFCLGQLDKSEAFIRKSLALKREINDKEGISNSENSLINIRVARNLLTVLPKP
jgi:tetratricopeptide (TPR) repeat protein